MPNDSTSLGDMVSYFGLGVTVCAILWGVYEGLKFLARKIAARKR